MDLKLTAFSEKSEGFSPWSTKFAALMHTKGLFRTVKGIDDLPTTGAPQPAGSFIACQCGRARFLRSVYSFYHALCSSA